MARRNCTRTFPPDRGMSCALSNPVIRTKRKTASQIEQRKAFVFSWSRPSNSLTVEQVGSGVLIHSARYLSSQDRTVFVRYLVEEGFISETYRGFSAKNASSWPGLQWLIGPARSSKTPLGVWRTNVFLTPLLVSGFILWLFELIALFLVKR